MAKMEEKEMIAYAGFFALVFLQSMSFTFISRARNRNNVRVATIASVFSNLSWLLVFRHLVLNLADLVNYIIYIVAMTLGTLVQMKLSLRIEKKFGDQSTIYISGGQRD